MPRRLTIEDLASIAVPEQPALSPDGTRIAYTLHTVDLECDRNVRKLWVVDIQGGRARPITTGPCDSAPTWSPDGARLAFLRAVEGPAQIWMQSIDGEAIQLTTLPLGAGAPAWSPDGSTIAFTAPVDLAALDGDEDAHARRQHEPIVINRLDYFADGNGLLRMIRRHLHVVDVLSSKCTRITDGDWHAGAPAWSPDGNTLAFSAAMDPDADLTRRSAAYVLELTGEESTPQLVGSSIGWAGPLSWTADGSALLVAGHTGSPDGHFRLLRIASADGAVTDLTAGLDRNVMFGSPGYPGATPRSNGDGRTVLFCIRDRGCTHLYSVEETGGKPIPVVAGVGRNVSGLSVAVGRAAFMLATESSFGEIASVNLATGAVSVHTSHGASLRDVELYPRIEREFRISDGSTVHGWLMRDLSIAGRQPVLLDIHGGPHNAWNSAADEVHLYHHALVAKGWTILLLNPRASDGYGEQFFTAAVGGWGIEDAKDFLEPLDALVGDGTADPGRLALTGYSYGGYMTCYLTSRDSRFSVAVAGGLISDLASMAGTADNRRSLSEAEFGGRPWADRIRYDAMSPMAHVENVSTPTLILQGGADVRCPLGQAQQWHTALHERGVPTQMVLYPDGSHVFVIDGRPSHRLDYNRRVVDWVEKYGA